VDYENSHFLDNETKIDEINQAYDQQYFTTKNYHGKEEMKNEEIFNSLSPYDLKENIDKNHANYHIDMFEGTLQQASNYSFNPDDKEMKMDHLKEQMEAYEKELLDNKEKQDKEVKDKEKGLLPNEVPAPDDSKEKVELINKKNFENNQKNSKIGDEIDKIIKKYNKEKEKIEKKKNEVQDNIDAFEDFIPEDALILLTDIIYYLTPADLYQITDGMKDGTVIVGSAHIPKYIDDEVHNIQFDTNVEGFYRLLPKQNEEEDNYQRKWVMKTFGNDHYYVSDLQFLKFLTPDDTKLIQLNNKKYDFILKCIATDAYDCGATYYTRFKIVKLTNPSKFEYLNDEIIKSAEFSFYYDSLRYLDNDELQAHELDKITNQLNKGEEEKKLNNFIQLKKAYEKDLEEKREVRLEDYQKLQDQIKQTEAKLDIINTQLERLKKIDEQVKLLGVSIYNSKTNNININFDDEEKQDDNVPEPILKDNKLYFVTRRKGLIFDTKYWLQINDIQYNIDDIEDIDIMHKITNRIIQLDKLDASALKSIISYANRELPDKDIATVILPLITKCLQTALETEMGIQYTLKTSLCKQINYFKMNDGNIEVVLSKEKSVFSRIYHFMTSLYGRIADFFTSNSEINRGNMDRSQFKPGVFKPQYFQ
jgi:hypothetical protein